MNFTAPWGKGGGRGYGGGRGGGRKGGYGGGKGGGRKGGYGGGKGGGRGKVRKTQGRNQTKFFVKWQLENGKSPTLLRRRLK